MQKKIGVCSFFVLNKSSDALRNGAHPDFFKGAFLKYLRPQPPEANSTGAVVG